MDSVKHFFKSSKRQNLRESERERARERARESAVQSAVQDGLEHLVVRFLVLSNKTRQIISLYVHLAQKGEHHGETSVEETVSGAV